MFRTEMLDINMGPQHPATHGVLRLKLLLDGETVTDTDVMIGYLHRGVEKLCETKNYHMIEAYTDRLDYVAAIYENLGYVEAVEKLMGVTVPERAEYIRVITAELQRIASHLVWLGTHALDLGAMTVYFYCFREREIILDLFEAFTGARLTYNAYRIGGLPWDVPPGWIDRVRHFVRIFPERQKEYDTLLTRNRIWLGRTKGVGILGAEDAIDFGVTGPCLRSAGVEYDVRKAHPYSVYDRFQFDIPVTHNCDTYDRYLIRMEEMRQSNRILEQALDHLPAGEVMAKVPKRIKPPAGEVYHTVEGPRGELGFYIVSQGEDKPYRMRFRSPSFVNLQALPLMVRGSLVADVVAVIGTLDIVLGDADR